MNWHCVIMQSILNGYNQPGYTVDCGLWSDSPWQGGKNANISDNDVGGVNM